MLARNGAVTTLHHVALGARDPDRLATFYRDVLGLPEVTRHFDGDELRSVWLSLGGAVLMIERIDPQTSTAPVTMAPGLFLLAVRIEEHERDGWLTRLAEAGAPVEDSTAYTSYTRDPEGNRVAVSFYPLP